MCRNVTSFLNCFNHKLWRFSSNTIALRCLLTSCITLSTPLEVCHHTMPIVCSMSKYWRVRFTALDVKSTLLYTLGLWIPPHYILGCRGTLIVLFIPCCRKNDIPTSCHTYCSRDTFWPPSEYEIHSRILNFTLCNNQLLTCLFGSICSIYLTLNDWIHISVDDTMLSKGLCH